MVRCASLVAILAAIVLCACGADPPRGAVVVQCEPGEPAELAGLEVDDRIVAWSTGAADGDVAGPLELAAVEAELGPYGVWLEVERGPERLSIQLPRDLWYVELRPLLDSAELALFHRSAAASAALDHRGAARLLDRVARSLASRGRAADAASVELDAARELTRAGEVAAAAELFVTARAGLSDASLKAAALRREGDAWLETGGRERAAKAYAGALAIHEHTLESSVAAAVARMDLHSAPSELTRGRRPDPACEILRRRVAGSPALARCCNVAGFARHVDRDFAGAGEWYRRALDMYRASGAPGRAVATTMINLGQVVGRRGDYDGAERLYGEAASILEQVGDDGRLGASCANSLGVLYRRRGQLEKAREQYLRALALFRDLRPGGVEEAGCLNNLGNIAAAVSDFEAAGELHRRSLELRERLEPDGMAVAASLNNLAAALRRGGHPDDAEEPLLRALEIKRRLAPGSVTLANTLTEAAELAIALDDLHGAETLHREALGIRRREQPGSESVSQNLFGIGDVARRQGRPEEAEHRWREAIAISDARRAELAVPEHVRATFGGQFHWYAGELAELLCDLDRPAEALVAIESSRGRALRAGLRRPRVGGDDESPDDLAGFLDPGTVALVFSVGLDRTTVFVVSADRAARTPPVVHRVDIPQGELETAVERFRLLVDLGRGSEVAPSPALVASGHRLYRILLEPVAGELRGASRLAVVADGPLLELPFAALVVDRERPTFLVEKVAIHHVASLGVFRDLAAGRTPGPRRLRDLLAVADPELAEEHAGLGRLPSAGVEVDRVVALFEPPALVLRGAGATETRLRTLAEGARFVHVAAHGRADPREPLRSAVLLTPDDELDGVLSAAEVAGEIALDAELVTLSACHSIGGALVSGEGLMGLAWGFHAAGARSVLVSQWAVEDAATAELMVRFYRHVRAGLSLADALRAAQLELLGQPLVALAGGSADLRHPVHWAALQLHGDWH